MLSNPQQFNKFLEYLERALNEQRIANDNLDKDEIRVGQGIARGINSILQNINNLIKR